MIIDLSIIKRHLNLDDDFTADDAYIEYLANEAEEQVQKEIDRSFEEIIAEEGEIPKPLLHTILLIVANFYANREPNAYTQVVEVPNSLTRILSMYRDYKNANI
jgi:uncharacterized phage protein (predicted DNA packaging)